MPPHLAHPATSPADERSFHLDWPAKIMLLAVLSSIFLAAMDQTVVSTALPTIARDLHAVKELPWVVTAYLLTSTVCLPVYGKLGDLIGRKPLLQAAIVLFLAGSALAGLSQNMLELIVLRALQGIGGGGLLVTAVASISDFIPLTERGRYQGLVGGAFGLATLIGPFLGGFIVQHVSWRWIFYINIPIGVAAFIVVTAALPRRAREPHPAVDIGGMILLTAGLGMLVLGASLSGSVLPWPSPFPWILLGAALTLLVAFVLVERRHPEPVLPLAFFRFRTFAFSATTAFFVGGAMLGSISFLPLYLQAVRGLDPTRSGLELLFLLVGMLVMSIVSGRLISRRQRYRAFPIAGAALITAALWRLSGLTATMPLWHLDIILVVLGIGLGMTTQVLVLSAQITVAHRHLGVATSTISLFRSMGGTLGVATFGGILATFLRRMPASRPATEAARIVAGLRTDFTIAMLLGIAAFMGTWFLEEMHILAERRKAL
ncbi:MDR family MFS transporter [Acidiferrobacter sp.]|uniref:MDR family MFS transporter n=1 Tax=Acidiferrobacter sp. TaxID=1872107 RepID=UPI00262826FB|nr:MDR family MFS transporter [Acidiferrobacter sp.]